MARLGRVLTALDEKQTPFHITPVVQKMLEGIAKGNNAPYELILNLIQQGLASPEAATQMPALKMMGPMFRNTVSPTIVRGGDKINVIPGLIELSLDGRMLPGFTPDQFVAEIQDIVGTDLTIEVVHCDPPDLVEPDMGQFEMLAAVLRELDEEAIAIPYLLPAGSDGRHFARLGIQNYGFTPMLLPEGFNFSATIHAADERIPIEALQFGTEAIYMVLKRYQ